MNLQTNTNLVGYLVSCSQYAQGIEALEPKNIVAALKTKGVEVNEAEVRFAQNEVAEVLRETANDNEKLHQTISQLKKGIFGGSETNTSIPSGKKLPGHTLRAKDEGEGFVMRSPHKPPLFSQNELLQWAKDLKEARAKACRAGRYDKSDALRESFYAALAARADEYPDRILDALLIILASRGEKMPNFADVFQGMDPDLKDPLLPTGIDLLTEAPKVDTPENRRLLFRVLEGLRDMPTNYAISAAVRLYRGNKKAPRDNPGFGIMAKENGWTEAEVKAVLSPFMQRSDFSRHIGHGPFCELFSTFEEVDPEMDGFATVRSKRNKELIGQLLRRLEARGLAPEPGLVKPEHKKTLSDKELREALRSKFESVAELYNGAANEVGCGRVEAGKPQGPLVIMNKVKDDQGRWVRLVAVPVDAVVISDSEDQKVVQVEVLDPAKLFGRRREIDKWMLKDAHQPWMSMALGVDAAAHSESSKRRPLPLPRIRDAIVKAVRKGGARRGRRLF